VRVNRRSAPSPCPSPTRGEGPSAILPSASSDACHSRESPMNLKDKDVGSSQRDIWDVVVVGGGIAGLTAAWYAARRGLATALFESQPNCGGQVATVNVLDDWPSAGESSGVELAAALVDKLNGQGVEVAYQLVRALVPGKSLLRVEAGDAHCAHAGSSLPRARDCERWVCRRKRRCAARAFRNARIAMAISSAVRTWWSSAGATPRCRRRWCWRPAAARSRLLHAPDCGRSRATSSARREQRTCDSSGIRWWTRYWATEQSAACGCAT